jgi:uncharacterized phage protein gp47/JayE
MAVDTDEVNSRADTMCGRIEGYSTITGSWTRDVLRSIAYAFEEENDYYDEEVSQRFIYDATGDNLDTAVAAEIGPEREAATAASGQVKITGQNGSSITTGMIVKSDTASYTVTEDATIVNSSTSVTVECTETGTIGNCTADSITEFGATYDGLVAVTNESDFETGAEEEDDETYRARALEEIQEPAGSWNKYEFQNYAKEVDGVDMALCIPPETELEKGSIRLILTDSDYSSLDQTTLDAVETYIEEEIMSDITINTETLVEKTVDIVIEAERHPDFDTTGAETEITTNIEGYFDYLIFKSTTLYYHSMSDLLKDYTESIYKLIDLQIAADRINITMDENEKLTIGTLTINWS